MNWVNLKSTTNHQQPTVYHLRPKLKVKVNHLNLKP